MLCQEPKKLDTAASITITILSIIVALVIAGTILDIQKAYFKYNKYTDKLINEETERLIKTHDEKEEPKLFKILLGFSAYTNTKKIFNVSNVGEGKLDCLDGIRFMSIGWVILGHTYVFLLGNSDNAIVVGDWIKRFSFQMISNATYSVDSFFVLSGLLTAYLFLKEVTKGQKITFSFILKYYIHRYIRLTPPLLIMILISLTLSKYFGSGPFYPKEGFETEGCKYNWWTNLLYVNNIVEPQKMCLGVTWYLGNDMQFHWISPLILIPLSVNNIIWNIIGIAISVLLIGVSILVTALVINNHPGSEMGLVATDQAAYFNNVYIPPWCRIGPFLVGLLLGYYIFTNKTKLNYKLRKEINLFLLLVSLVLCGIILFGLYEDYNGSPLSKTQHILYQASSRTLWAIGLGYIILACLSNQGGIINKFLSAKFWIPLSRLSFGAYLVHLTFIYYYISVQERPYHYQDLNIAILYIGILVVSFVLAFLFSILFEIPLISLERFIFKRK